MKRSTDRSSFPNLIYADMVLKPLFENTRQYHSGWLSMVNRAHCVMLGETGILSRKQTTAIAHALKKIEDSAEDTKYQPCAEDLFFAVEMRLNEYLGPDLAGRLHTGRSRNDMDHTIFRLALIYRLDMLLAAALDVSEVLLKKSFDQMDTVIVAYTHGQPAQPTTFGHYLFAVLETVLGDIERLAAARLVVDRCPMGAAAITTTGFQVDRARMAELLGFAGPTGNSYASIAGIEYLTSVYSSLKLLFLHLGRVIQDLQFWSSFEIGQLYVPNDFVQVSSIMPQKRNPVPIEHLRLFASKGAGEAETILTALHNTPFTDMNDSEGEMQVTGYRSFDSGMRMLVLFGEFIQSVTISSEHVIRNIDRSCLTITELADELVRTHGLSFRQSHEIAAQVTRTVIADQSTLQQSGFNILLKMFGEMNLKLSMDKARFEEVVSAEHFISVRNRPGGPGPEAMCASQRIYRRQIDEFRGLLERKQKHQSIADYKLETAFQSLLLAD